MPYIPQSDRKRAKEYPETPGELNYALTQMCLDYLDMSPKRYADHAEVIGALECCKLEFARRALTPLENDAIIRNGDGIYS